MTWDLVLMILVLTWLAAIPLLIVASIAFDRARGQKPTPKNNLHH